MSEDNDMIRMVVKVSKDAQPELYEELCQKTPKSRAERFRTLAAMALMGRSAQYSAPNGSEQVSTEKAKSGSKGATKKVDTEDEQLKNRRRSFMKDVTF